MKKKGIQIIVSIFMVINMIFPYLSVAVLANDFIIVDDNVTDTGTTTHYFTYSEASDNNGETGWSNTPSPFGANELQTQHWVWNGSNAEASKHSYTFSFVGTGVELMGVTPTGSSQNTFKLDGNEAETLAIETTSGQKESVLYSKKGLAQGSHTVQVTLPTSGNQKGLQISYARVFGATQEANITTKILPNMSEGSKNKMIYTAPAGRHWTINTTQEAYIDLGTSTSVELASQSYYEIPFVGNSIDIFANKNSNHGKVRYSVDGGNEQVVDLYNATRTTPQSVYKISNLAEGNHTLKAVLETNKSGSNFVNQFAYANITHKPYSVTDINLNASEYRLVEGVTQQISFSVIPDYAPLDDVTYSSSNATVAEVSNKGLITANSTGEATITVASASSNISKEIAITVEPGNSDIGGSIVATNTQYTQDRYDEVKGLGSTSITLNGWKNDKAISEISLFSKDGALKNVKVTASDFTSGQNTISASNMKTTFIKSTKAYNGAYLGYGSKTRPVPEETATNRSESNDILYQDASNPINIGFNKLQNVWVELNIPKNAVAGTYTGSFTVTAEGIEPPLVFTYSLKVEDAVLKDVSEFKNTFNVEFWQYPYSSAEYYDVTPFSEEHLNIMRSGMEKYKDVSGSVITASILEEAWAGQTYSAKEVHYPSMVKWTKDSDNTYTYDFTDFDKWVAFNKELGIGDKIVLYSIAPWNDSFSYWENGVIKYEPFITGSERYIAVWTDFLTDLTAHLTEKGWYDDAYIGIDERGFSEVAFDVIESVTNSEGKHLKTAGSMDNLTSHANIAMRVTDLNIGDTSATANPALFAQLVKNRDEAGLRTALYTCTEHQPGNFSLSSPVESYWMVANDAKIEGDGIMRWAYDAWVADPLNDTTHNAFEPGDCFMIYPDHKDALNPTSKSSVRLEKIFEGIRDVNKLIQIENEIPALKDEVDAVYSKITGSVATQRAYLTDNQINTLIGQVNEFRTGIADVTQRYIDLKEGGTNVVESVDITENDQELTLGRSLQLHAIVKPDNLLNSGVLWSSSNDTIASVSATGVVTPIAKGNVVITATSKQDATKSATMQITITDKSIDENTQFAYYSFDDENANDGWGSRNGTVNGASFVDGKSNKALHVSEADKNVTFTDVATIGENDPWSISYWVNSTSALTDRSSVVMDKNKDYSADLKMASTRASGFHVGKESGDVLTFSYPFEQETWYNVIWTQSKTEGLCMYVNGTLVGTANAWSKDHKVLAPLDIIGGTGFVGYIDEVKVYNKALDAEEVKTAMIVQGINVAVSKKDLFIEDTFQIEASLVSDNEDKTISYTSSDPEVASVNEQGLVTALKRGSVTITVENKAGGYKTNVVVNVTKRLNIANKLHVYQMPESNLSTIEKEPGTPRQYLGQPDMVRTVTGRLITSYPIGHGKGALVMQMSDDEGKTWKEKTNIPRTWSGSQETPTMYTLNLGNGKERIMLITACPGWGVDNDGNTHGWNTSYSDDNGETWTEYAHWQSTLPDGTPNKVIVGMASLIQLKDEDGNFIQKWMGVFHNYEYENFKSYLTFDENGEEQWSAPEKYLSKYRNIESNYQMCEIGMFRSPDGNRIVGLSRSQSHNNLATLIYSDDEGETWSKPMDLPGSLAGERHKAQYDPSTGRLVITFREIAYDQNGNNQFDGNDDWMAGEWVAWVGTYEDLMEQNEGQYRIEIAKDYANNAKSGDTGYAGFITLPDGTFVMNSYGHWDEDFSLAWTGGVTTDLCYIKQAKFKLAEIDNLAGIIKRDGIQKTIADAKKIINELYTEESWNSFESALEKAIKVEANKGSNQTEIDEANQKLSQAQKDLVEEDTTKAKNMLKTVIDKAKAMENSEDFKKVDEALQELCIRYRFVAESVYNNSTARIAECMDAWRNLEDAVEKADLSINKALLLQLIEASKTINTNEYNGGVEEFEAALLKAEKVYNDVTASLESIQSAYTELENTKNALSIKEKVDKDSLSAMIQTLKDKVGNGSNYKQDKNFDIYEKAFANAMSILEKEDATQKEIDQAINNLKAAYLNIELLPTKVQIEQLDSFISVVNQINRRLFTKDELKTIDAIYAEAKFLSKKFNEEKFEALQSKISDVLKIINRVQGNKPVIPEENESNEIPGKNDATKPQTGDSTNKAYALFMILMSGGIVWIMKKRTFMSK